jgi:hypothetical protein
MNLVHVRDKKEKESRGSNVNIEIVNMEVMNIGLTSI